MSRFFIITLIFLFQNIKAVVLTDCGTYKFRGQFVLNTVSPLETKFIVLMGTASQHTLKFKSVEEFSKINAYSGKFIEIEAEILKQDDLDNRILTQILTVKKTLPDPLQMQNDIVLLDKKVCE